MTPTIIIGKSPWKLHFFSGASKSWQKNDPFEFESGTIGRNSVVMAGSGKFVIYSVYCGNYKCVYYEQHGDAANATVSKPKGFAQGNQGIEQFYVSAYADTNLNGFIAYLKMATDTSQVLAVRPITAGQLGTEKEVLGEEKGVITSFYIHGCPTGSVAVVANHNKLDSEENWEYQGSSVVTFK